MSFRLSNAWKWSRAKVFLQRVANELYKMVVGYLANMPELLYKQYVKIDILEC